MSYNLQRKFFTMSAKDAAEKYSEEGGNVSQKLYKKIVTLFLELVFRKIIQEEFSFMMPYGLGVISVKSYKPKISDYKKKRKFINWKKTKELGKRVYHLNTHTNGYSFYIDWDTSFLRFRNKPYYKFRATKSKCAIEAGIGSKGLSKYIFESSKDPLKKSYIKK